MEKKKRGYYGQIRMDDSAGGGFFFIMGLF